MLPGMEMLSCPNLAVSPEVMQHVVQVESGANPYAIGVVGGQLVRQPRTLGEALATAQMLETKGYNYSLGIAQVNRTNLRRYGLDSYQKAFTPCDNLQPARESWPPATGVPAGTGARPSAATTQAIST